MAEIGKDIVEAKKLLTHGELVAIPTETVYGLAGNALDTKAITKIFQVKNRPSFDPLIVHTYALREVKGLVNEFPERAQLLASNLWPGPLTLLLPRRSLIPDLVTSGMENVAIRIPKQPLVLELLRSLDFPLVAPSANPFGYVSPTSAQHVNDQLGEKINYILDGGPCPVGIESTIVGFKNDKVIIHRMGGISKEDIESIVGPVEIMPYSTSNPTAPGMLKSHYAPIKKLVINQQNDLLEKFGPKRIGALRFDSYIDGVPRERQILLAKDSSITTAAQNLFSALRLLDKMDIDIIIAELVPEKELGPAINDRLRRAAAD